MRSAPVILVISLALPPTAKQPHNSWDPEIPILQIYSQDKHMHMYNGTPIQEHLWQHCLLQKEPTVKSDLPLQS